MTQAEALNAIQTARDAATRILARAPGDVTIQSTLDELGDIAREVRSTWPLSAEVASDIEIGLFAVRELEDVYPELADLLERVDYEIKLACGAA